MPNDSLKKVYDAVSTKFDLGTYDEFAQKIKDPIRRKKLFDAVSNDFDLGDYNTFNQKLGFDSQEVKQQQKQDFAGAINTYNTQHAGQQPDPSALGYDVGMSPKGFSSETLAKNKKAEEEKLNKAAENTFAKTMGQGAYTKGDSAKLVNNLKAGVKAGDLIIKKDAQGNDVIKNSGNFLQSFKASADLAYATGLENNYLRSVSKDEAISYLNRVAEKPETGIVKEPIYEPSGVSQMAGQNADFLGKATMGAMALGQTGLTGGGSIGSFLAIVDDLDKSGYSQQLKINYYQLKQEGLSDSEAFDKATHAALVGEAVSLGTGALLSGEIKMLSKPTVSTEGFTKSLEHTFKSAPKVLGATAAGSVVNDIETNAIANGNPIDAKEMAANAGEHAKEMAVMHFALGGMTAIANGQKSIVPSYARPQMENIVASADRNQVTAYLSSKEQNGEIPQGTTAKVLGTLSKFDQQKAVVAPFRISEESKAAIAGKLVQKQKLLDEKASLKPNENAFPERINEIDKEINGIDGEINKLYNAKNPFEKETDTNTGDKSYQPKTFEELKPQEKNGIIVPKEYGDVEIVERGEGENKTYTAKAYSIDQQGSLSIKKNIHDEAGFTDKDKAQAAADNALKQHYYENGLHDNAKPDKKIVGKPEDISKPIDLSTDVPLDAEVKIMANKIARGEQENTPEAKQFYENNKNAIENELRTIAEKEKQAKTEKLTEETVPGTTAVDEPTGKPANEGSKTKEDVVEPIQSQQEGVARLKNDDRQYVKSIFPETKILNKNNEPLKVYHGSRSEEDFNDFERGDIGFHFGDKRQAEQKGDKIIEAFLDIKNPLKLNDKGAFEGQELVDELYKVKVLSKDEYNFFTKEMNELPNDEIYGYDTEINKQLRQKIKDKGYDGIQYQNMYETGRNNNPTMIALYPHQILMADGRNLGTILKSKSEGELNNEKENQINNEIEETPKQEVESVSNQNDNLQSTKNSLIEDISKIPLEGVSKTAYEGKPEKLLRYIQKEATGINDQTDKIGDNNYEKQVKLYGEDIVNRAIEALPEADKQRLAEHYKSQESIPEKLKEALGIKEEAKEPITEQKTETPPPEGKPPLEEGGGEGKPPEKPPVDATKFSEEPNKETRVRGAYRHLMESNIPEDIKQKFKDKGITYEISKNESAQKVGRAVVDSFGTEEAVALARRGDVFSPSVNSAVYSEAINDHYLAERNATNQVDKFKAAAQWANLFNEYAEKLTGAGQFGQYAYNFYKTSPLGFILSAKERLQERRNVFLAKDEKSLKEAFEAFKDVPEFQELFQKEVGEAVKKSKNEIKAANKKKISDAFDKFKLDKNAAYATFVPPPIINGAIEAMKQAVLLGYEVADVIAEGVKYINARHKEGWNEQKFKDDFAPKIEGLISENTKQPSEKTKEKILNKWDKKLTKLEPQARKELLSKVLNEIVQNGGLEYDKFREMYADALGLPGLTPEMETKLHELGGKLNAVDVAKENLEKTPTEENITAFKKAMAEGEVASREINDLLGDKGITLDRFLSIAKLNTLGVANLLVNPFFNIWFMPVRFLTSITHSMLDYGLKYSGFPSKDGIYENTIFKQRGYAKGLVSGTERAIQNIVTGDNQFDYFQKATRQNIQPIESAKDLIAHHKGEKKLTNAEYANALMEAFPTMGGTAAIISRGLQLGDLPFRFAAERGTAESIAKQKKLTGAAKEAFILNPDEASAAKIKDAGEKAVMAQDNLVTGMINSVGNYLKHATKDKPAAKIGTALGKIAGSATQPFLKIPLNSAMTVFELAVPEFSIAKGIYHAAIEKDRTKALESFSKAVVGMAIGMAFTQISKVGLVTATEDDEKKINASIYQGDIVGTKTLNYTGLKRYLRGGDPTFKDGDVTVDMQWLGVPGSIMLMQAQKFDKMKAEDWDKQGYLPNLTERISGSLGTGIKNNVFGNTSTLLGAMDGNSYSTNKWLRGSSNVLMNAFEPSWLSTASRISDNYKPDYSAMNLKEQMAATLKERFWKGDDLPKQITVWGEKRADAPKGTNEFLYYYADITKHRNVDTNDFGYNILALYNKTKEDAVIPSRPQKTVRQNNTSYQLTPKQYEEFQVMVGKNRKQLAQALMSTHKYNKAKDDEKIKMLKGVYSDGYDIGKLELEFKYFDIFKQEGLLTKKDTKQKLQREIKNSK